MRKKILSLPKPYLYLYQHRHIGFVVETDMVVITTLKRLKAPCRLPPWGLFFYEH